MYDQTCAWNEAAENPKYYHVSQHIWRICLRKLLLKTYLVNNLKTFMQIRIVINATEDPEPRQTLFHPANILH